MSPSKSLILSFLILTLVALVGCGNGKATPPNYSATETASARYYQTQAAESLANATSSTTGANPDDTGTFPAAACVIALVVVAGMVFLFVQSRRRRSFPR